MGTEAEAGTVFTTGGSGGTKRCEAPKPRAPETTR
jgi:hypothetical protein